MADNGRSKANTVATEYSAIWKVTLCAPKPSIIASVGQVKVFCSSQVRKWCIIEHFQMDAAYPSHNIEAVHYRDLKE